MKKIQIIISSVVIGSIALSSCSTTQVASTNNTDNLYFMASDARIADTYAVPNNNPETFDEIANLDAISDESFSSRNVNPEYLARYSAENTESGDEVVYFDDNAELNTSQGNINAYDNYRVNDNSSFNSGFNSGLSFSMGFMMGTGFNPWIPGFYNPYWGFGPSWGYRPGISVNIGFGLGWGYGGFYNPYWGPRLGWGGFYDPFWGPGYGWGYPGWGMPIYAGRPIYVLPGGEYGDRRIVRGARPSRGATLAGVSSDRASAILPNTSRSQARNSAVNNRSLVSSDRSRQTARDFSSSQSDYYNSGRSSRLGNSITNRNTGSAAMDRSSFNSNRSAMPSARPSRGTMNTRTYSQSRGAANGYSPRSASPSYSNRTSPSYNRSSTPGRSYNYNGGSNTRTYSPSRSSSPQMSMPSRSSSGGGIMRSSGGGGGVSRSSGSSSSGSRGGRGN
ncbi:MAG: hypothetical protein HWE15_05305 [Algoriphagus sp.]|uniref:hypothetical protein n=1 Tax=Algoriphagus sp. TaxID=1872435 RepID=UPI0017AD6030|nr:hypothetical protein [Algoriphagus sp.]NVJ85701.1 hypothetical protein [Algoriphagus sp.]